MFLIDEFNTGSDPELGGALAEIFLEFYHRAFLESLQHYSNLKFWLTIAFCYQCQYAFLMKNIRTHV
jgi:hypothetical protein